MKLVSVFGLVLLAAIIIFPITYIFGDVLTEVYGYPGAAGHLAGFPREGLLRRGTGICSPT